MRVAVYSSFTFSYWAKARTLSMSLKRFHSDWDFYALVTDLPPEGINIDIDNENFDFILWSKDIGIPDFENWIRQHNIVEACTAVKGFALYYLSQMDYDAVIYLDPDVVVFGDLSSICKELETNDILLTPHQLEPEQPNDVVAIKDNELCSLTHGVYNLGFVAVRTKGDGVRFAQWWRDRLYRYCREDIPNGMFTDQRWCDLVPAFFDKVKILRDPGYNVASWNLSQRRVAITENGDILVNGSPIKFFHFTKLGPVGRKMTERYAGDNTEVYELWSWYSRQVAAHALVGLPEKYWAYGDIES